MTYEYIMVRFGELSTKGKNKKDFINVFLIIPLFPSNQLFSFFSFRSCGSDGSCGSFNFGFSGIQCLAELI